MGLCKPGVFSTAQEQLLSLQNQALKIQFATYSRNCEQDTKILLETTLTSNK